MAESAEKSHGFLSMAEEFFHHVVQEAQEAGHTITEGAHKIWDAATGQAGPQPANAGPKKDDKPAPTAEVHRPILHTGSKGPEVRQLQELLNSKGASIGVDGDFGDKTAEAVRHYQKQHGVAVDGVANDATWAALEGRPVTPAAQGAHETANEGNTAQGAAKPPVKQNTPAPQETTPTEGGGISLADAQKHVTAGQQQLGQEKQPDGSKEKAPPPNSQSAHKTKGGADLVATFGTVKEASANQGSVKVAYTDGLMKEGKTTREKTDEELEGAVMKTGNMQCHSKIAPLFQEIFDDIKDKGDWKHILQKPGSFCPRQNRNNPTEWSIHSWGTAVDVNPTTNPNGGKDASYHQHKISNYFTSRGFTWLEHSDAMHFQYHDGGSAKINDSDIADIKNAGPKDALSEAHRSLANDIRTNLGKLATKEAKKPLGPADSARKARYLEMLTQLGESAA